MRYKNRCLILLLILNLLGNASFSQNSFLSIIKFNIPVGSTIVNRGGLSVKCVLLPTWVESTLKASLGNQPNNYLLKRRFTLYIEIVNTGTNPILITDWHFRAICPENSHGQQWQEPSYVTLLTPYIPTSINLLFNPGDKKSFNSSETDFFWCLPEHELSLLTEPCGITALITCSQVGTTIYNNGNSSAFSPNSCDYQDYDKKANAGKPTAGKPSGKSGSGESAGSKEKTQNQPDFDPALLALMNEYKKAQASGDTSEVIALAEQIAIAGRAYPDRQDEIKALMKTTPAKVKPAKTPSPPVNTVVKKETPPTPSPTPPVISAPAKPAPENNSVFSDWLTVKNPYYSMQVRYRQEKQVGDIAYYKAQFRINYNDNTRCVEARCLGYAVCFGYPTPDEKDYIYLHYKFYYPYNDIYTMPELIPIKVAFPDGSGRILKNDGFYYTTKTNTAGTYFAYFDKSVDLIVDGLSIKCKNFIESKAVILR